MLFGFDELVENTPHFGVVSNLCLLNVLFSPKKSLIMGLLCLEFLDSSVVDEIILGGHSTHKHWCFLITFHGGEDIYLLKF